jgi:hypothetical protein
MSQTEVKKCPKRGGELENDVMQRNRLFLPALARAENISSAT